MSVFQVEIEVGVEVEVEVEVKIRIKVKIKVPIFTKDKSGNKFGECVSTIIGNKKMIKLGGI